MRISQAILSVIALAGLLIVAGAQQKRDMGELVAGAPIERELTGGDSHIYRVTLTSGKYLHVVVEQRGIDVVVTVFGPDGQHLVETDSSEGTQGSEQVSVLAESSGDYRLEVRSKEKEAAPGRYEIRIEELREATQQDRSRVSAERIFAEGQQLHRQGTAETRRRAIEKYEEAIALWRAAGDRRFEATTLNSIGEIYSQLGEKQKALEYYSQALPLNRAVGDRRGEAETLSNIGVAYSQLGEKQKALEYYSQALPLNRAVGDRRGEAYTLSSIGKIYIDLGEAQKTLDYYGQALPLMRAVRDRRGEAFLLGNIGATYWTLGENQEALGYYGQALPLMRALGDRRGEAFLLANIGKAYTDLGEAQKALDYYDQALSLIRAAGDRQGEAYTLSNIGVTYSQLGDNQKALDYYGQALPLRRALGDRQGEAITLSSIGKAYADLGEAQKALDYYGQALSLARAVGDRGVVAKTLGGIARVEHDRGNLIEARAQIKSALDIVESLRSKVASPELRASYFASKQTYYEFYIDLLMQMHERQPSEEDDVAALEASERGRARSLLDSLAESRVDIRQGIEPELLERERSLQQRLQTKERNRVQLLSGKHTEEQAAMAEKELGALLTEYQEVQTQIRATSPRYAALTQPQPLGLKEIQKILDEDTLLLEYALGQERSYLWAVTPASIASFRLPKRVEIEAAARRTYELLIISHKRESKREAELRAAELSQMILGPVAEQLGKKRLLIVAEGALQYVPFGALPVPRAEGGRRKAEASVLTSQLKSTTLPPSAFRLPPLIVEHEIVSLPSASVLAVLRRELEGREPASKMVAVLADPVLQSDDPRVKAGSQKEDKQQLLSSDLERSAKEMGTSFERLRFSRQEAEAIVAQAGDADNLKALDFDASRSTVTGTELDQYRMLHFATHAILNSQHPELSGIVLSLVDEKGEPQDGFVRAHEVYNLKLKADLVVLSACRTALGKEIKGEGLVGLVRGFMYAGAARVVASMWDVRDEATAELMKRFYRGMLKEGKRPAAALRMAQVSMWKEKRWEAPYYWAGFVLQGEWK